MKHEELTIEGMSCNHCVMALKKELSKVNGLVVEQIEVGKARIQYDEAVVTPMMIAHAIDEAGFKLKP